ncbi:MAG: glycoside hydrolase family 16 protein [Bacteroidota bacterium]|nr:glycoside hydrolase family 16 protein [Bacteroidota bacterium]
MKGKIIAAAIFAVIILCGYSFTTFHKKAVKPKWKLVWQDEFNYEGLPDSNRWSYDVGGEGWGNDELQYYTHQRKQNAEVSGGCLHINAVKEKYQGNQYTSTRLVTRGKKDFGFGKIEIKAKLPKGRGVWPAVWMLSSKTPRTWPDDGEIDIMENVGYAPGEITGAAHVKKNSTGNSILSSVNNTIVPDASDEFHIYTLTWTPEKLEWFVDNKLFHSYEKGDKPVWQWPFDGKFYLLINIAVGGSWGGKKGIDEAIFPQTLKVDYVRVYAAS